MKNNREKTKLMKLGPTIVSVAVAAFSLTACERDIPADKQGVVSGEVYYLQRIALPQDAVVTVQLEDVTGREAEAEVLAEQRIELQGSQIPVNYELVYDRRKVEDEHRYAVAARIEDSSGLRFIATELYGVSLAEPEAVIDIQVDPVLSDAEAHGGPTFRCSGNEPFWNFELSPEGMEFKRLADNIRETRYQGGYTALFGPDGGAFYEWIGRDKAGVEIKARILPGHCDDTMAGPEEGGVFDYSVGITLGEETLAGCCRMPEQAAAEPPEEYRCENDTELSAVYEEVGNTSQLTMVVDGDRELVLSREISASGAKYSDGGTVFWSRGNEAILELDGNEAVRCELAVE